MGGDASKWLMDAGCRPTADKRPDPLLHLGNSVRPRSNGMAEAFVRTLKRDYVRISAKPDARTSSISCQPGSITITKCIRIARSAIDRRASLSTAQPVRPRQVFRGQQHQKRTALSETRSNKSADWDVSKWEAYERSNDVKTRFRVAEEQARVERSRASSKGR
jgi:hypothetical protein